MAQIRNGIIEVQIVSEEGTEVPTVQQAKDWLKMPYSTDDTLIAALIKTARKYAESYCSSSIISKIVKATFTHDGEKPVVLPRGPVGTPTLVRFRSCRLRDWTDITTETTIWEVEAGEFMGNCVGYYEVTYPAGFEDDEQPADVVTALKRIVARLYEKRGDEKGFELTREEMELLNANANRFWA